MACREFLPQLWRKDTCFRCFKKKLDHAESLLEEHLNKDDPTEVFELLEMIGHGSYGSVFKAREKHTQMVLALKFIRLRAKGNNLQNAVNEINILKDSLECPYIVEYRGCYMKEDTICMVMEYCYCSMADILNYCPEIRLSEVQVAAVCACMIKGLVYLHSYNVTHRDVKAANLLLSENGAKLADFGISVQLRHANDTMKNFAGSPYWCAPEVITDNSYNNKVDLWSAGIVAIELAEKRPPYWEMEPMEVIQHIPHQLPPQLKEPKKWSVDFKDFLDKCLKKNAKDRPSAVDLLQHPFILSGSSNQILQSLINETVPLVLERKKKDMLEKKQEQKDFAEGTILSVNNTTHQANVVLEGVAKLRISLNAKSLSKDAKKKRWFGAPLEESIKLEPHITHHLLSFLSETAVDVTGVFGEQLGDLSALPDLRKLCDLYESGQYPDLTKFNLRDAVLVLKLYLYELPSSLISLALFSKYLEIQKIKEEKKRLEMLKIAIAEKLSNSQQIVLHDLLSFLGTIHNYSALNSMDSSKLANELAPLLLFKGDIVDIIKSKNLEAAMQLLRVFIENQAYLFN